MKNIEFYCYKTWDEEFKQITIIPTLHYVHNTYVELTVISISFLFWDCGIRIYSNENK
jgi:hypothetical protein